MKILSGEPKGITVRGGEGQVRRPPRGAARQTGRRAASSVRCPRGLDHASSTKAKRPATTCCNFFECLRDRSQPVSDACSHHRAVSTCHLANIAIRLGRKIEWDPAAQQIVGDDAGQRLSDGASSARAMRSWRKRLSAAAQRAVRCDACPVGEPIVGFRRSARSTRTRQACCEKSIRLALPNATDLFDISLVAVARENSIATARRPPRFQPCPRPRPCRRRCRADGQFGGRCRRGPARRRRHPSAGAERGGPIGRHALTSVGQHRPSSRRCRCAEPPYARSYWHRRRRHRPGERAGSDRSPTPRSAKANSNAIAIANEVLVACDPFPVVDVRGPRFSAALIAFWPAGGNAGSPATGLRSRGVPLLAPAG